ncbi:MAG: ABC transporter ATP-binding protein [Chloroflexota bacterium]|nr:ABC transporter ATP-binding protein [Chloroflexota bacterium]
MAGTARVATESTARDVPALHVVNLSKRFGGVAAVANLNLTVRRGITHCIIGPNGAGKSTFFDLVTNVQPATSGEVYFFGEPITGLPQYRRAALGIARKFQAPTLFPELTVAENLYLGKVGHLGWTSLLRRRDIPAADDQVGLMLEQLRLAGESGSRAADLSHGQQQWLEIGVALMARPRLLLLDEPTAGMSLRETAATADLLGALTGDTTTVIVEHDLSFVRRIADVITVMHRGESVAEGRPDEIAQNALVRDVYLGRKSL